MNVGIKHSIALTNFWGESYKTDVLYIEYVGTLVAVE